MACNSAIEEKEKQRRLRRGLENKQGFPSGSMLDSESNSDDQPTFSNLDGDITHISSNHFCRCRCTNVEVYASDHAAGSGIESTSPYREGEIKEERDCKEVHSRECLIDSGHHRGGGGSDNWSCSSSHGSSSSSSSSSSVKGSRHRSTLLPCSCGDIDEKSKDSKSSTSPSFRLDEATLSRHMCTAGIPGESR